MRIATTGIVLLTAVTVWVGSLSAGTPSSPPAPPQAFSSGSTGADGALNLATTCSSPVAVDPASCYVQLPPSGVLNYTTVNVPVGKVLKFRKNLQNTPVIILAQGDVTVAGVIYIGYGDFAPPSGVYDTIYPGPGGFRGGAHQQPGFGPAGGTATSPHATWVGPLSLVPIIGGSGGFGTSVGGVGGGGAIAIASSRSISVTGHINANSGQHFSGSGAGAGGAIRLVANSVHIGGSLNAPGGLNSISGQGLIRLEAPLGAVTMSGSSHPAAIIAPINPAIFPSAASSLTIISVGGQAVPAYAGQRFDTVDLLLPMQLPDPINIVVSASNIPVGTPIQVSFGTGNTGTVTPGTLAGSLQASTATARLSGLNRTQLAYLYVHATFAVLQGADAGNPPGPNQVAQVQASAPPGGATHFAFLRKDGSRISERDIPPQVLTSFRR